jgi:hypothetical protein
VPELVEPLDVVGLHRVPGDDQHVVAQLALVEVFQHREGVRSDVRQKRVGGSVEHLNRRHVRLEVPVIDQFFDSLGVAHEGARLSLIPQPVGVTDAVGAVQRAPLDVVEAEAALAVLDDFPGTLRQSVDLFPAQ